MLYKTFSIDNKCFAYDTVTNEILLLSKGVYDFLNEEIDACELSENESNAISSFRKSGMLSPYGYEKITFPYLDNFDYYFNLTKNNIKKITIVLNQLCNFNCTYCLYGDNYEKRRNLDGSKIKIKTAIKIIDFYFQHSSNIENKNITFYGGEPLIDKHTLFSIIEYARNYYDADHLKINLTTNGSLIDHEIVDFFSCNGIYMNISIDGPQELHDKFRKTKEGGKTYELLINKLKFIKKYNSLYYKEYIAISLTVTPPYNFNKLENYFNNNELVSSLKLDMSYVEEKDADWLFHKETESEIRKEKTFNEIEKINECSGKILKGEKINDLYKNIFTNRIIKIKNRDKIKLLDCMPITGPCFPGLSMLLVDCHGNFHICTMTDDCYCVGNINEGFKKDNIKKYLFDIYKFIDLTCKNCWLIRLCHPCVAKFNQKESLIKREQFCLYKKDIYLHMLKSYVKIYLL